MNYQQPHAKGRPSLAALPASSQDTSEETPWPLSHFSGKLRAHIDRVTPTWVEGQLVEFNLRNGTAWMTLRDLEQEISFTAVAWRNTAGALQEKGLAAGSRVVALVKPSLWEKTGRLSLVTQKMEPVGLGDLLARIERLKASLAAEGLFDEALKKPLPVLPRTIGIITGRNSDAKKDILRNVTARWSAAEFAVEEVATQGSMAPMEVASALERLDAREDVDVVVIARGGGALEEVVLPFSDERLIRAVAAAETRWSRRSAMRPTVRCWMRWLMCGPPPPPGRRSCWCPMRSVSGRTSPRPGCGCPKGWSVVWPGSLSGWSRCGRDRHWRIRKRWSASVPRIFARCGTGR